MVLRWLSAGIAIGAAIYAYQNPEHLEMRLRLPDFGQLGSSFDAASMQNLQEFWHRTFHMTSTHLPFREQSHIRQHPPPKDALHPRHKSKKPKPVKTKPQMPMFFVSHGNPSTMFETESMPYRSWQNIGQEIRELNPKAIVVTSSHWEGNDPEVYVNTDVDNPLICGSASQFPGLSSHNLH